MIVQDLIQKKLGSSGRLNTDMKLEFIPVKIRTKEDRVIWSGDFLFGTDRDKLLEVARLSQKTLYIHKESDDTLIGKVHVQLSLFDNE